MLSLDSPMVSLTVELLVGMEITPILHGKLGNLDKRKPYLQASANMTHSGCLHTLDSCQIYSIQLCGSE